MLDFPNTPVNGSIFTAPNGLSWQFDGTKWIQVPSAGQPFIADAPQDGQGYVRQNGLWVPAPSFAQGHVNKLRNSTFDVWQRTTSGSMANAYCADGWIIFYAGTAGTWAQISMSGGGWPKYGINITGIAGNTSTILRQPIESFIMAPLGNNVCTLQAKIYNGTPAALVPYLSVGHFPSIDSGAVVQDVGVSLQSCPAGQWTTCAATFQMGGLVYQGGYFQLQFGALLASQYVYVTAADLRLTPGMPVGLCANPPPVEMRPVSAELAECQRYYEQSVNSGVAMTGDPGRLIYNTALVSATGDAHSGWTDYKATKRVNPTLTIYNPQTGAAGTMYDANSAASYTATIFNNNQNGFSVYSAVTATATTVNLRFNFASSAEL